MSLPSTVNKMRAMFEKIELDFLESKGWEQKCIGSIWYWHLDLGDHFVNFTTVRGALEFQQSKESFK